MTELYFVRHGQCVANAEGVLAGRQDSPLTELGIEQAREEAVKIRNSGLSFDMIVSSPLSRAYDTARIIAEENDYPAEAIVVIDDLREKESGDFEGRPTQEIFVASDEQVMAAEAETFDVFAGRVKRANAKIAEIAVGTTLIVGHSAFYRMASCIAQGLEPHEMLDVERPTNGNLLEYPL